MIQLIQIMNSFAGRLAAKVPDLCLLARFVFAAVLLVIFGHQASANSVRGYRRCSTHQLAHMFKSSQNKWKPLAMILASLAYFTTWSF